MTTEHEVTLDMATGRGKDARLIVDGRNLLKELPVKTFTLAVGRQGSTVSLEMGGVVPTKFRGDAAVDVALPPGWRLREFQNRDSRWMHHDAIGSIWIDVERRAVEFETGLGGAPLDAVLALIAPGVIEMRDEVREAASALMADWSELDDLEAAEGAEVTVSAATMCALKRALGL